MALRKQEPNDNEAELKALYDLEYILRDTDDPPRLITSHGIAFKMPEAVIQRLKQVVHYLAYGEGCTIIPTKREVTTQEAAQIIHVSRPHVVKLLEDGEIPYRKVGSHRRIPLDAVLEYKRKFQEFRRRGLEEIMRIGEDILAESDDPRLR